MLSELRVNVYQTWMPSTSRLAGQDRVFLSHRSSRIALGKVWLSTKKNCICIYWDSHYVYTNLDGYLEVVYLVGSKGKNGLPQPEDAS